MSSIYHKYARLLVRYCLDVKKGETVYVRSTYLAEPLLQEVQKEILLAGGHPHFRLVFSDQDSQYIKYAEEHQLDYISPFYKHAIEHFDCYLNIMAPFNRRDMEGVDPVKLKTYKHSQRAVQQTYMKRTSTRDMKRNLCLFPTNASAQEAGMSFKDYEEFVYEACYLFHEDPVSRWLELRKRQQKIVDHLNNRESIRYRSDDFDLRFSTKGRIWINSDGQTNMPSGEVYTSPVEDSVSGTIRFSYPAIYMGREIEDIRLWIEDGEVKKWEAKRGQELLDQLLSLDGARRFGEAAIGTNYNIRKQTRNILFDEKMGGTVHMALGQSYYQTGGKNNSDIHWDLVADMKQSGEIFADDELIYKNGKFIFS